jgi:hypothetical protein
MLSCSKSGWPSRCCRRITKIPEEAGHLTRVVIPCYDTKFKKENKFECVHWGFVKLGKFDFHLMYLRKQLINWDLSYTH